MATCSAGRMALQSPSGAWRWEWSGGGGRECAERASRNRRDPPRNGLRLVGRWAGGSIHHGNGYNDSYNDCTRKQQA